MRPLRALILLGAALCVQAASTQLALAQVIEGTVVDSVTGAPIGGASVQIENAGKSPYQTVSDEQGAFRIEGVADGNYTAFALKNGYLTVQDDAARRPFRVVAGLDAVHLKLSLTPRGRISGHIFDASDRPVTGADVSLRQGNGAGQNAATGADGGFSFEVVPGSYVLCAVAPAKLTPPEPVGDQHYAWAKTCFPGLTDLSAAQKILIHPGSELDDQDIKLRAVNAYRIRGQLRDSSGSPAPKLTITLARSDDNPQSPARSTLSEKDGSFEFGGLPDGDWRLSAEQQGSVVTKGFASVTITGRDADDMELRLNAPFSVPVEFRLEAQDSNTTIRGTVLLVPQWGGQSAASSKDQQGNYKIDGVYPGRYLVKSLPLAGRGYYLASITLADRDVLGQMVELSSGSTPIKIVYRSDGGAIRGTVDDCGNASIVVVPQDSALQLGDIAAVRVARCTEDGHFEIRNLRPALYYAFAFDHLDANTSTFLAALPPLINKAVSVEVKANQTANVELKVSSAF
jgi:5-hydroxyisourate hydrolase-like protein (transthyretin family)